MTRLSSTSPPLCSITLATSTISASRAAVIDDAIRRRGRKQVEVRGGRIGLRAAIAAAHQILEPGVAREVVRGPAFLKDDLFGVRCGRHAVGRRAVVDVEATIDLLELAAQLVVSDDVLVPKEGNGPTRAHRVVREIPSPSGVDPVPRLGRNERVKLRSAGPTVRASRPQLRRSGRAAHSISSRAAIRGSGSRHVSVTPRAANAIVAFPVPAPTSSTSLAGSAYDKMSSIMLCGISGSGVRVLIYRFAKDVASFPCHGTPRRTSSIVVPDPNYRWVEICRHPRRTPWWHASCPTNVRS